MTLPAHSNKRYYLGLLTLFLVVCIWVATSFITNVSTLSFHAPTLTDLTFNRTSLERRAMTGRSFSLITAHPPFYSTWCRF